MRLIDADKLKYEAELCRETTDAFQKLIDRQPDYHDPVPVLVGSNFIEVRGHPLKCPKCSAKWIMCTEEFFQKGFANYCPNCGQAVICI